MSSITIQNIFCCWTFICWELYELILMSLDCFVRMISPKWEKYLQKEWSTHRLNHHHLLLRSGLHGSLFPCWRLLPPRNSKKKNERSDQLQESPQSSQYKTRSLNIHLGPHQQLFNMPSTWSYIGHLQIGSASIMPPESHIKNNIRKYSF